MSFLSSIAKFFGKSSIEIEIKPEEDQPNTFVFKHEPVPIIVNWRQGMWVMHEDRIAIIHRLNDPCVIHFVDPATGETIREATASLGSLRQARYNEIPACRNSFTVERALELGYGS